MKFDIDSEAFKTIGEPDGKGYFSVRAKIRRSSGGNGFEMATVNGYPVKSMVEKSMDKSSAEITKDIMQ